MCVCLCVCVKKKKKKKRRKASSDNKIKMLEYLKAVRYKAKIVVTVLTTVLDKLTHEIYIAICWDERAQDRKC